MEALPKATGAGRETVENTLFSLFGQKGAGKSTWLEEIALKAKKRLLILDTLCKDYTSGDIITDYTTLLQRVAPVADEGSFRLIVRIPGFERDVLRLFAFDNEQRRALMTKCTLVVEEVSWFCDTHTIDPSIQSILQYGRHSQINLVTVARWPFEINRNLTRAADFVASFRQTEPNDLKYFRSINEEQANRLPELGLGELVLLRGEQQALLDFIAEE